MTLDDILVLGRMGFTLEQVKTLANAQPSGQIPQQQSEQALAQALAQPLTQEQALAQARAQVQAQVQPLAQAQVQPQAQVQVQAAKGVDDILTELGIIKDTMQANARLGAEQPKQRTTDDILAEIINPPIVKAGEN